MNKSFLTRRIRRGISLMEVLISMFVLTVGLLGVAALIPAGRHEIVEAAKLDNAAMVGRAAFRDMQVRGFLNPAGWNTFPGTWSSVYDPATNAVTPFNSFSPAIMGIDAVSARFAGFVIDPMGLTAPAGSFSPIFPAQAPLPTPLRVPPLVRIAPFAFAATITDAQRFATFDSVFRGSFDQILEPNATNPDFPPSPKWFSGNTRRMSEGNYSWMATVVSDPTRLATTADVTVSVAVFYKRDLSNSGNDEVEREVEFPALPISSGSSIIVKDIPRDASGKLKPFKPGQWFMLGGMMSATSDPLVSQYNYYRWYKVIAAAPTETVAGVIKQRITIAGADWQCTQNNTRAWIFDNIVNVYEKQMPLEVQ